MFKTLSQGIGFALSLVTVLSPEVHADIAAPDDCWPDCMQSLMEQECVNYFGIQWYYCGWNAGWVYCCGGE